MEMSSAYGSMNGGAERDKFVGCMRNQESAE